MELDFSGKQILITGGLGFLGSSLARRLVELGGKVTVVDNLNPLYGGNSFNLRGVENAVEVVLKDARDLDIMAKLVERANVIFHAAAQVSYIDSLQMPNEDLDLNARATLNILELSRRLNRSARVVFFSSRMVYGNVAGSLVSESAATNPLSLYGIHKLTSERYLQLYHRDFGIPVTALRITNPYGPRQQVKHSKYSLVGWFVRQAMEGREIKIFGDGGQLRDYIFVDDIVSALLACSAAPGAVGEVINVGSGDSTKFRDMVSQVVECVGRGVVTYVPWPDNYERVETGDISIDISKLHALTLFRPLVGLRDGIKRTFDYYSEHMQKYV
jgi:UDP-glucose 4-epimerase